MSLAGRKVPLLSVEPPPRRGSLVNIRRASHQSDKAGSLGSNHSGIEVFAETPLAIREDVLPPNSKYANQIEMIAIDKPVSANSPKSARIAPFKYMKNSPHQSQDMKSITSDPQSPSDSASMSIAPCVIDGHDSMVLASQTLPQDEAYVPVSRNHMNAVAVNRAHNSKTNESLYSINEKFQKEKMKKSNSKQSMASSVGSTDASRGKEINETIFVKLLKMKWVLISAAINSLLIYVLFALTSNDGLLLSLGFFRNAGYILSNKGPWYSKFFST